MKISVNGKFVRQIRLTGTEPEFHYGYGVFETLRTYHGQIFELAAHLRRLRQSADTIHLQITPSNKKLEQWLLKHCALGERRLKLIAAPSRIYILSTQLTVDPTIYQSGVAVTTYAARRVQPLVKGNAWVTEYLAYEHAQRSGYFDALLVGAHDTVPEAACGNLFVVRRNTIFTAETNVLRGITRQVVQKIISHTPYRLRYRTSQLKDILAADECFITKTTTGIVPVVHINQRRIGTGKPGPVTQQLITKFEHYVERTAR